MNGEHVNDDHSRLSPQNIQSQNFTSKIEADLSKSDLDIEALEREMDQNVMQDVGSMRDSSVKKRTAVPRLLIAEI